MYCPPNATTTSTPCVAKRSLRTADWLETAVGLLLTLRSLRLNQTLLLREGYAGTITAGPSGSALLVGEHLMNPRLLRPGAVL